jgi:hypothetical protein
MTIANYCGAKEKRGRRRQSKRSEIQTLGEVNRPADIGDEQPRKPGEVKV